MRWLGLAKHAADERRREHEAEYAARSGALKVGHGRLQQFVADGRISPEALAILRARHEYRAGRLPQNISDGGDAAALAADIRMELIAAEREHIYRLLQDGQITDEARPAHRTRTRPGRGQHRLQEGRRRGAAIITGADHSLVPRGPAVGRGFGGAANVYKITQLLPPEGDDFQYKIKSAAEPKALR